jgi:hypothetical protein
MAISRCALQPEKRVSNVVLLGSLEELVVQLDVCELGYRRVGVLGMALVFQGSLER